MSLYERYLSADRSLLTKADKVQTVNKLSGMVVNFPNEYISIVRALLYFKMYRKTENRANQASTLLELQGILSSTTMQTAGNEVPTEWELMALVMNRSAIWKSDIPATFKEHLNTLPNHVLLYLVLDRPDLLAFMKKAGVKIVAANSPKNLADFTTTQRWIQANSLEAMRDEPTFLKTVPFRPTKEIFIKAIRDIARLDRTRMDSELHQNAVDLAIRLVTFNEFDMPPENLLGAKLDGRQIVRERPMASCIAGFPLSINDVMLMYLMEQGSFTHLACVGFHLSNQDNFNPLSNSHIDFATRHDFNITWEDSETVCRVIRSPILKFGVTYGLLEASDFYIFRGLDPNSGSVSITHKLTNLSCIRADGRMTPF